MPQTFKINPASQTITFDLPSKAYGDPDFTISATSELNGNEPVTFSATGACSSNGNTVHIKDVGMCTIQANRAGNSNYNPASVSKNFAIRRGILVTKATIGCLDIQKEPNLTDFVAWTCNSKTYCQYPAPTEDEYREMGVEAKTRTACTQAMDIEYYCTAEESKTVRVNGNAWSKGPAILSCRVFH